MASRFSKNKLLFVLALSNLALEPEGDPHAGIMERMYVTSLSQRERRIISEMIAYLDEPEEG
jgi:hypothetical protein